MDLEVDDFVKVPTPPLSETFVKVPDDGILAVKPSALTNRLRYSFDTDDSPVLCSISDLQPDPIRPKRVTAINCSASDPSLLSLNRNHLPNRPKQQPKLTDFDQSTSKEKVKTKLKSVWNNVKYGWTIPNVGTSFEDNSPIFILGKCYHSKEVLHQSLSERDGIGTLGQFRSDFYSRLWFTYRRNFPKLHHSDYTTDCGWGCMLRSGQSLLAQALVMRFLGRAWRLAGYHSREQEAYYRQIIRWFGDFPSRQCPFSIHRLVRCGEKSDRMPGDWYGPSSVAYIIREAIRSGRKLHPLLKQIAVYIATDCTVYIEDIIDLCTCTNPGKLERILNDVTVTASSKEASSSEPHSEAETKEFNNEFRRSVIILVPVRLGGETFNPIYVPCLKNILAHDSCIGIIGGKPKHAMCFVGWQDDKLIYLDPHYCQDAVDMRQRDFSTETFHCSTPRKIRFSEIDPSCTIGFVCNNRSEFNSAVIDLKQVLTPPFQNHPYAVFEFISGRSRNRDLKTTLEDLSLRYDSKEQIVKVSRSSLSSTNMTSLNDALTAADVSDDDFVLL